MGGFDAGLQCFWRVGCPNGDTGKKCFASKGVRYRRLVHLLHGGIYLPAHLPTYVGISYLYLPAYPFIVRPTFLPTYLPTYLLLACLPISVIVCATCDISLLVCARDDLWRCQPDSDLRMCVLKFPGSGSTTNEASETHESRCRLRHVLKFCATPGILTLEARGGEGR